MTPSSVNLHAEIDPNGIDTRYHFDYIEDTAYEANLHAEPPREGFSGASRAPAGVESDLGSATVFEEGTQHLGSLTPSTTYRFRVQATNSAGSTPGPVRFFTTEDASSPAFALPDQRGWEMVSPAEKNGGSIQGFGENFGGDVLQAAAQGGAITYSSASSFGAGAQGAPGASQYVSRRQPAGWSTENVTAPSVSGAYGSHPDGVPFQLFSPDLSAGLILNGEHCRGEGSECPVPGTPPVGSGAPPGYQNYYLRDQQGAYRALLNEANDGDLGIDAKHFGLAFAGATPDLGHIVVSTCAALTDEATEVASSGGGCDAASPNLYEWSGSAFRLINLLPGELAGTPGASLAARGGAISANGSRVYWTEGGDLYLREGGTTEQVDAAVGGGGEFQTASSDGSAAFFLAAGHLYRYLATGDTSTDLTPGGEVRGVLGASQDGSYVYYASAAGLFLWHNGSTVEVAAAADPSDYPPTTGRARVSADGTHLAFVSSAAITDYDNTDAVTGLPDSEVFLYDAVTESLVCASCNPNGERPQGSASVPGAIANGTATKVYKPRVLAGEGRRLFFDSRDSLVLQDTDSAPDVYEWEAQGTGTCQRAGGCVALVSSGRSAGGSTFVDASAGGSDVFFLTGGSLVPTDPGAADLYDAREGGGFPAPVTPLACDGDACQGLPPAPEDPTPGTLVPGAGNPPISVPKAHAKKAHRKKQHRKRHRSGGSR